MQADIPIAGPTDVPVVDDVPPFVHDDIPAVEAKDLIDNNPNLIIVDVREESEYCATDPPAPLPPGHIPGAILLPWNTGVFQSQFINQLPINGEILIVCRSGNRSHSAANMLDANGYTNVSDMSDGMLAWVWETEPCTPGVPSASPGGLLLLIGLIGIGGTGMGIVGLRRIFSAAAK